MKKTISLLLSLVMLLSVTAGLNFNAYAAENITGVAFTVPGDLEPVAGTTANTYDITGKVTASATGNSFTYTLNSTACEYQKKNGNYWIKVGPTETFEVGQTYRLKVSGCSSQKNLDTHNADLTCTINDIPIAKADGEVDSTGDFFYINGAKTIIFAYHYYGQLTANINSVTVSGAQEFEYGKDITINPYQYHIDDHLEITNIAVEYKDGTEWKNAIGTKYICNTKYRFVIDIKTNEGYTLNNNFSATVKSASPAIGDRYANKKEIKDGGKAGTFYCEFPNVTKAHTFGTAGDARFTCSVCGAVDAEKKAEVAAADALAAAQSAIAALPEAAKVTAADKDKIEAARKAFDALTDEQKAKFTAVEYKKLVDAEAALAALSAPAATTTTTTVKNPYTLTFSSISKIKKSAKKTTIKLTLKKNGKILKSKNVTLTVAGKTYKAKTNKKGVATFTIKKAAVKKLKVNKKTKLVAKYGKNITKTKQVKVVK